ncbi:MAG: DUF1232 domain-containing protein [Flammeovirgaceae bacterium]|nr:DUF1232 domain-containing protein [Flammeovirgaceae bacterium]
MEIIEIEDYKREYKEALLWKKIKKSAKKAGIKVVYAALLLYYALQSEEVPKQAKITIIGVLGYFLLPLDLIPDLLPGLGFTDDFGALILALSQITYFLNADIKFEAKQKLADWFSEYDEAMVVDLENQFDKSASADDEVEVKIMR